MTNDDEGAYWAQMQAEAEAAEAEYAMQAEAEQAMEAEMEGYTGSYSALSDDDLKKWVDTICRSVEPSDDALAIRKLIQRLESQLAAKNKTLQMIRESDAKWSSCALDLERQLAAKDAELETARMLLGAAQEGNRLLADELTTAKADQRFYREEFARVDSELAGVKAERDGLAVEVKSADRRYLLARAELYKLRPRIESAPKVFIWYLKNTRDEWRPHDVTDSLDGLSCTLGVFDKICHVHAVPVEEKE